MRMKKCSRRYHPNQSCIATIPSRWNTSSSTSTSTSTGTTCNTTHEWRSSTPHYNVVIVGGGVVGSTLALLLSQQIPSLKIALLHGPKTPISWDTHMINTETVKTSISPRVYALSPVSLNLFGESVLTRLSKARRISWYDTMQVWESDGPAVLRFTSEDVQDVYRNHDSLNQHGNTNAFHTRLSKTLGAVIEDEPLVSALWDELRQHQRVDLLSPASLQSVRTHSLINGIQPSHHVPISLTFTHSPDSNPTHLSLTQNGNRHSSTVQSSMTTDLLVAADGANSFVRRTLGLFPTVSAAYGRKAITCTVLVNQSLKQCAFQRFQPNGPIALLPVLEDSHHSHGNNNHSSHPNHGKKEYDPTQYYANIVWSTTPEECAVLQSLPKEDFMTAINSLLQSGPTVSPSWFSPTTHSSFFSSHASLFGEIERFTQSLNAGLTMSSWTERNKSSSSGGSFVVPPIVTDIVGPRLDFDLHWMQARKYVHGQVVLVGDAAHSVHPMAGQGLNLGLGDVKCLVQVLKEAADAGMLDGMNMSSLDRSSITHDSPQSPRNYDSSRGMSRREKADATIHSNPSKSLLESYFLKTYEVERQRHVSFVQGGIQLLHGAFSVTTAPAITIRSLGMNIVNGFGSVRRTLARIATGN